MRIVRLSLISLALLACAALPVAAVTAATNTLTVTMNAQNNSGETGTATLTDVTGGVQVVLAIKGAPSTAQPAHIHTGTCADLKGVVHPLTSVTNGSSTTVVKGVTIADLLKSPMAINVHKSAADLATYVSCGNIVAASSGSM
jgi:hypothetical protein